MKNQKQPQKYHNILSDDITPEYIVEALDNLTIIAYTILPMDYIYYGLATVNSILIDDIMEMDSIPYKEKQEAIKRNILMDMPEFITLAKDLLAKIKSDQEEVAKGGYCPELMKHREE